MSTQGSGHKTDFIRRGPAKFWPRSPLCEKCVTLNPPTHGKCQRGNRKATGKEGKGSVFPDGRFGAIRRVSHHTLQSRTA